MRKNNRAARATRTLVEFFDVFWHSSSLRHESISGFGIVPFIGSCVIKTSVGRHSRPICRYSVDMSADCRSTYRPRVSVDMSADCRSTYRPILSADTTADMLRLTVGGVSVDCRCIGVLFTIVLLK